MADRTIPPFPPIPPLPAAHRFAIYAKASEGALWELYSILFDERSALAYAAEMKEAKDWFDVVVRPFEADEDIPDDGELIDR